MMLGCFAFFAIIYLASPVGGDSQRFWTFSCQEKTCGPAFLKSIELNCYGNQCKSVIEDHYSKCSKCSTQLLDNSHHVHQNGEDYLICAPEDDLQVLGCQFKCRVNYKPQGKCLWLNNLPVCQCNADDGSDRTTTEIPETTPYIEVIPFGTLKRTLEGHADAVWSLAALKDGSLASSSKDSFVKIWDVEKEDALLHSLERHSGFVWKVIELSDGTIASGGADKTICIWDSTNRELLHQITGLANPVDSFTLLSNGQLVSSELWKVRIWNQTRQQSSFRAGDTISVYLLKGLKNGHLAVGGYGINMDVKIYDPNNGFLTGTLKGHKDTVWNMLELDNGDLATCSSDGTIKIWDRVSQLVKMSIKASDKQVRSIALLSDGYLASGSTDHTIKIWNLSTGELKYTLEGHTNWVLSLAVLGNGDLASASVDKTIKIWHTRSGL